MFQLSSKTVYTGRKASQPGFYNRSDKFMANRVEILSKGRVLECPRCGEECYAEDMPHNALRLIDKSGYQHLDLCPGILDHSIKVLKVNMVRRRLNGT